ncbi:MAG TPA: PepSY-associated TM helix domain-containing protein [Sphingomonas sp.]|nr:PepSY-associated TM helix domain-containing protein [Sphingomonas sp.]
MTKLQLRRAWFQVHKWIGLILAVLIIPLSLSGALLVWDKPVDRLLNPARYAVSGAALLPPHAYADAARAVLGPGQPIASLTFPDGKGPVVLQASMSGAKRRAGPPSRISVWLDPPTARVLDVADSGTGVLRVMHRLHGSLMVPGIGRKIVGWIGVAMMLSCFTGLWLWWPTVGSWLKGLRWRRHRNLDTNLHHLVGFWIALPLFVLSLTGAWISFPGLFGGGRPAGLPGRGGQPIAAPTQSLDTIAAAAERAGGTVRTITWPTAGADPDWRVALEDRTLTIGDRDGAVAPVPDRPHGGPGLAGAMRRIHDGEGMGPVWQAIIFVGGILPAALAVTGLVMWWRARGWRAAVAARKRPA